MVKREAVKSVESQKHQMISALYANSAFDKTEKGIKVRQDQIKEIESHFNKAIELIYNPELHKEQEIDWNNPFWAAARRAQQRRLERVRGETVGDAVQAERAEEQPQRDFDQT